MQKVCVSFHFLIMVGDPCAVNGMTLALIFQRPFEYLVEGVSCVIRVKVSGRHFPAPEGASQPMSTELGPFFAGSLQAIP